MDDPARELAELLERARQGCQQAARLLYERYGPAVQHAVRRRLAPSLRRHFDSADFIQSVWGSFFTSPNERLFPTPDALVAFLSKVAYNKVAEEARRIKTRRRDASREVSLDEASPDGHFADQLAAPTPTPSQHAQVNECWDGLRKGLSPGHRRALELKRAGHSFADIADRLGVNRKDIQRLLERLEQRLDRRRD
jgi:RNA polymerase sigma factor (sigma-70 family)